MAVTALGSAEEAKLMRAWFDSVSLDGEPEGELEEDDDADE